MAITTLPAVIVRAQFLLQDTTNTRWTRVELGQWINDAYKEIVLLRPDANAAVETVFLCDPGSRQSLESYGGVTRNINASNPPTPLNALRLLDVVRNMSGTPGAAVAGNAIRQIDRRILDDQKPDWHLQPAAASIQHFMFDPKLPKQFLVYPPAAANMALEVVYSKVPTPHVDADTVDGSTALIKLDDIYVNAILDYLLYRAYSKDAEYAANAQRAEWHHKAFMTSMGAKSQADAASMPLAPTQRGR